MNNIATLARKKSRFLSTVVSSPKVTLKTAKDAQAFIGDAVSFHVEGLFSYDVLVYPEAANWIVVNCNNRNRKIVENTITKYARLIANGDWLLTSQSVAFATDGQINNGQHTFYGAAKSETPVWLRITFGEEPIFFRVHDNGRGRGPRDILFQEGYKDGGCLSSSARLLHLIEQGNFGSNPSLSNSEILRLVEGYPELGEAVHTGRSLAGKCRTAPTAMSVAVYLISKNTKRHAKLAEFIDMLGNGAPRDTAVHKLREGLIKKRLIDKKYSGMVMNAHYCANIIDAWNAFLRGDPNFKRWSNDKSFPVAR